MTEMKAITKLCKTICDDPASHINQLNTLIPQIIELIETKNLDITAKEKILQATISLVEAF